MIEGEPGPGPAAVGYAACPACGGSELLTEPAVDADGAPTGELVVLCSGCGCELGALAPPPAAPEAEPTAEAEGSLFPDLLEEHAPGPRGQAPIELGAGRP